ncbi:MAG: urease accessory protein UreD [Salaquimonas sp.]
MINTAGGLTGGDQIDWQFTSRENSSLTVTSQACERIYQSSGGVAQIHVNLRAEKNSTLFWLPQETILFEQCAVHRKFDVFLEHGSRLLLVEPLIFGRKAMNEAIMNCQFKEDWRIRNSDGLIHAEAACFSGHVEKQLQHKAVLDGHIAIATILLIASNAATDLEGKLNLARAIIGDAGGISLWEVGSTGKLLARIVAKDGYDLRKCLVPLITLLIDDAPLPKSWAI